MVRVDCIQDNVTIVMETETMKQKLVGVPIGRLTSIRNGLVKASAQRTASQLSSEARLLRLVKHRRSSRHSEGST